MNLKAFDSRLIRQDLRGRHVAAVEVAHLEHPAELLVHLRTTAGLPGHLQHQVGMRENLRSGKLTLLQHCESLQSRAEQFVRLPCVRFPPRAAPRLPLAFQPPLHVAAGKAAAQASGTPVFN